MIWQWSGIIFEPWAFSNEQMVIKPSHPVLLAEKNNRSHLFDAAKCLPSVYHYILANKSPFFLSLSLCRSARLLQRHKMFFSPQRTVTNVPVLKGPLKESENLISCRPLLVVSGWIEGTDGRHTHSEKDIAFDSSFIFSCRGLRHNGNHLDRFLFLPIWHTISLARPGSYSGKRYWIIHHGGWLEELFLILITSEAVRWRINILCEMNDTDHGLPLDCGGGHRAGPCLFRVNSERCAFEISPSCSVSLYRWLSHWQQLVPRDSCGRWC